MSQSPNRPQQLILIFKEPPVPEVSSPQALKFSQDMSIETKISDVLREEHVSIRPVFGASAVQVMALKKDVTDNKYDERLQEMDKFYTVESDSMASLDKVKDRLMGLGMLKGFYYQPRSEPPIFLNRKEHAGSLKALGNSVQLTHDLTTHQIYLAPAPAGIDVKSAWDLPGGKGDGVTIIDIEGGWNFNHQDLKANSDGLLSGFNYDAEEAWFQHGTAVLGEMGGDTNTIGVTGICPNASIGTISVFIDPSLTLETAGAIRHAADVLRPGDIILIEQHRPGPNHPNDNSQVGYIPIEWWPADFLAILYATSKDVIVVEAAGNGSQNLNDAIYDQKPADFPDWWTNPFNRVGDMDSGAIIVGAGAPPPGTHGRDWGVDRSRLWFSNYGSCVDTQGWGEGVTTCGYGDIHGQDIDKMEEWYTDLFAGTSSASPIVAGVVACLQGIRLATVNLPLAPRQVRGLLQMTGSPQQADINAPVSQKIGNRPDLSQLIKAISS